MVTKAKYWNRFCPACGEPVTVEEPCVWTRADNLCPENIYYLELGGNVVLHTLHEECYNFGTW